METLSHPYVNLLNKLSFSVNVLTYYGFVDQCYELEKQLCKSTRRFWEENYKGFCSHLMRNQIRTINIKTGLQKEHVGQILRYHRYSVFKFCFNLESEESQEAFINLVEHVEDPTLLKFERIMIRPCEKKHIVEKVFDILWQLGVSEDKIVCYVDLLSTDSYKLPFVHNIYTPALLEHTHRAHCVTVRPPIDWLRTVNIPASKINVILESSTIQNFSSTFTDLKDTFTGAVKHCRLIAKDDVPKIYWGQAIDTLSG